MRYIAVSSVRLAVKWNKVGGVAGEMTSQQPGSYQPVSAS
jgi:hypothetical protein